MILNQVPNEWLYDPDYRFKYNNTTAMMLAKDGIIPPREFYHNPEV